MLKQYKNPQKSEVTITEKDTAANKSTSKKGGSNEKKDTTPTQKQVKDSKVAAKQQPTSSIKKSKSRSKTPERIIDSTATNASNSGKQPAPKKKVQFEEATALNKEMISVRSSANDDVQEIENIPVIKNASPDKNISKIKEKIPSVTKSVIPSEIMQKPDEQNNAPQQRNSLVGQYVEDKDISFMNPVTEQSFNPQIITKKVDSNGVQGNQNIDQLMANTDGGNVSTSDQEVIIIKEKRQVLDHMARIDLEFEADVPQIVSFHYLYKDYLDDNNLMDPERAQMEEELERKRLQKSLQQQQDKDKKDDLKENEEQLEYDDDDSNPFTNCGKAKYETLIKSMIARIEFNNCLAPIQEYGRHQTKAAHNKKKKNKKKPANTLGGPAPVINGTAAGNQAHTNAEGGSAVENGPRYDDNFYDLDDDFIDDGELEINQDEMVSEMLYDQQSNFFSQVDGSQPDENQKEEEDDKDGNKEDSKNKEDGQDEESMDEDEMHYIAQEQRLKKLLKVFKIFQPEDVEMMLKEKEEKEQRVVELRKQKELQNQHPHQQTLTNMLHPANNQNKRLALVVNQSNPNVNSAEKITKNQKKRDREEAFGGNKTDDNTIDEILTSLRTRVLNGETLNNFKKEISTLADLVEKKDPTWSEKISQIVCMKLSQTLQKNEQEILCILQRTSLLEKKKKKKAQLDKMAEMIKSKIEFDLKNQNKKTDEDYVDLEQLDPITSKFVLTDDHNLIPSLLKLLEEYVQTNKEYITVKILEEKTKSKKQKSDANIPNHIEFQEELDKIISNLISGIPATLKDRIKEKVLAAFGVQSENQLLIKQQPTKVTSPQRSQMTAPTSTIKPQQVEKEQIKIQNHQQKQQQTTKHTDDSNATVVQSNKIIDITGSPKKGKVWNKVNSYYDCFSKK